MCLNNTDYNNDDNIIYRDFCFNNIPNFSFDKTYIENKTLFILKNNNIISIFKLDVLMNIFCVSCLYVNTEYFRSIDDVNNTYKDITDFILHSLKLTSNNININVDICNVINFKIYLYCNMCKYIWIIEI